MPRREPVAGRGRLIAVSRIVVAFAAVMMLLPAPAGGEVSAQSGPTMEVTIGLGGITTSTGPSELSATIATPVLVSGRLRVRGADIAVSRTVEVPAGGEQTYRLAIPPLEDGIRLTVELLDSGDERLLSETVTVRTPSQDELAVGVLGDEGLIGTLGRVRTVVTDRPVAAVSVPAGTTPGAFEVLDYLVLGRQAGDSADDIVAWATDGTRVVVDSALVAAGSVPAEVRETGIPGVSRAEMGGGELVLVEDLSLRSADEWATILRPTALEFSGSAEMGFPNDPRALLQAASESGSRQVPTLPWLLFAILGFALAVGPVNFVILSRLDKRDWAWLTIPAIALLSVMGFWVAGRQRIAGTNLTHASVIVAEGTTHVRSAVLVAAGVAGERTVAFDDATATVYPERSLFGSAGTELRMEGDGVARVELDQLGFTGIGMTSAGTVELPRVTLDGDRLSVENPSSLEFWGWGVASRGSATVAPADLAPGGSGEVAVPIGAGGPEFGFGFVDALMNQRRLWEDPVRSNSLWPFSQILTNELGANSIYFVGLTDDFRPDVSVDGAPAAAEGPTLVMIEVDGATTRAAAGGNLVRPEVVDTGFINWLDWGPQQVISTDEMTVRFELPDAGLDVILTDNQQFGIAPQTYQAWDWGNGEFVDIERGAPMPGDFVSSDGQVYVRLVGADEFGDNPMSPANLALEWET